MAECFKVLSHLSCISEHYGVLVRQILSRVFVNLLLMLPFLLTLLSPSLMFY